MLSSKSNIQITGHEPGRVQVNIAGMPVNGRIEVVPQEGTVRDWLAELNLPKDWTRLEELAQARGLSARFFRTIVFDESLTCWGWRYRPEAIQFQTELQVTLAHLAPPGEGAF